jgi:Transposase DDE domain
MIVVYPVDGAWADDARMLLHRLKGLLPSGRPVTLLADRIHAGDPFLTCLDQLGWGYVIRLPEDAGIQPDDERVEVRHLRQRARRMRVFRNVRLWKGSTRRSTVGLYRSRNAKGETSTCSIVTNLAGEQTRFVEYACRWWQECGWKGLQSALFEWERSRISDFERVDVLLIGISCAIWAMWLLGREHEQVPVLKPTTSKPQPRRKSIIECGISAFTNASKHHRLLTLSWYTSARSNAQYD